MAGMSMGPIRYSRTPAEMYGTTPEAAWRVSPTGEVWQESTTGGGSQSKSWGPTGQNAFSALTALATGGAGGGGVGGGGGAGGPALLDFEADDAADRAARTDAKERAATRLQASLKGLDAVMQRRGIRGSGLQGERAADLFAESSHDEFNADLNRLNQNASRRFDISNRNQDATNRFQLAQMDRADRLAAQQQQLALTLAQFGMRY